MSEKYEALNEEALNDVIGGSGGWYDETGCAKYPPRDPDPGYRWYHISSTDTLSGISNYCGMSVSEIVKKNKNIIKDPRKIGQHMWIQII